MINNYRPDIDGLRAYAVCTVLFFHLNFEWFSGGYLGVDIFFVISGYLITNLIKIDFQNNPKSFTLSSFYIRRAKRLLPAFFFTLFICLLFSVILLTPNHLQEFTESLFYASISLSNIYFLKEISYFSSASEFKPLLHTWSLSLEEQFYVVWPILLFLILKIERKIIKLSIVIFLGALSLQANIGTSDASYFINLIKFFSFKKADTIFYLMPFRFYEFLMGAVLVWIIPLNLFSKIVKEILFIVGILIIACFILMNDLLMNLSSYHCLFVCFGTMLIILSNAKYCGTIFNNKICILIGKMSYSLYLIHWPIIVFYKYTINRELEFIEKMWIIVFALIFAYLMYHFIESKFRYSKIKPYYPVTKFLKFSFSFVLLFLFLPGGLILIDKGWKWRVPEKYLNLNIEDLTTRDFHIKYYGGADCEKSSSCKTKDSEKFLWLLGDSHARQYAYGLKNNLKFSIQHRSQQCLFADLDYCINIKKYYEGPDVSWKKETLKIIKKDRNILIISHWWPKYKNDIFNVKNLETKIFKNVFEKIQFHQDQFILLGNYFKSHPIIIFGAVPETRNKFSVVECILAPFNLNNCASTFIPKDDEYRILNRSLSKKFNHSRILFINPFDYLCDDLFCKNLVDGKPIYSDTSHLSIWGSDYLIKKTKKKIIDYLSKFK